MFPRPLATTFVFQYTVTGDLSCMKCMICDSLFVFVSLYCDFNLIWGSRKTTLMWLCCSPIFTSVSIYGVNVFVFDMYKEWTWEINILYIVSCILYLVSCILYLVSCILYLVLNV